MINEENANTNYHASLRVTDEIRLRAHAIWEERGGGDGHDVEDWLQAEEWVLTGCNAAAG